MNQRKKVLLIIDGNSVLHRAFHALPPLRTKNGELVNAIYGFFLVFLKALNDLKPDFLAVCFDVAGLTFRHNQFQEYKIHRKTASPELYQQIPKLKEILVSFGAAVFEKEGFEADDIIGTISYLAPKKQVVPKIETVILSGDSDIFQLVDKDTKVYFLKKGVKQVILYNENAVKEKYQGLEPKQLPDLKSLQGDPSDNIPGVSGIGEKTAIELLKQFGSLDEIYKNIALIRDKIRKKLILYKEDAFMSRNLAQINRYVPIEFDLKKCSLQNYNKEQAEKALERFEFYSLIGRLPKNAGVARS